MGTSIKISEKIKEELFLIKKHLELKTGQEYSLEEIIKWLINRGRDNNIDVRKKLSEELFGIAESVSINDVSELRMQKGLRFESV